MSSTATTGEVGPGNGAVVEIVSLHQGDISSGDGADVEALRSLINTPSVVYDAVLVADGEDSVAALAQNPDAHRFVQEAFRHHKAIGTLGHGLALLTAAGIEDPPTQPGVVVASKVDVLVRDFRAAIAKHRHWDRVTGKPPHMAPQV